MLFRSGYKPREGYYLQTTTYLIGRKELPKNTDDDGLFSFMRTTELKEQERDGLFLRNLDQNASAPTSSLKIVGDLYSNLGFMAGVEGKFKPNNIITDISFGLYAGFSNTLFPLPSCNYSIFSPTGETYTDYSLVFGQEIPLRYYGFLKMNLTRRPFNLAISIPH